MPKQRDSRRQRSIFVTEMIRATLGVDFRSALAGTVDEQGTVRFRYPPERAPLRHPNPLPYVPKFIALTVARKGRAAAERAARVDVYRRYIDEQEAQGLYFFRPKAAEEAPKPPPKRCEETPIHAFPAGARAFERVEAIYDTVQEAAAAMLEQGRAARATVGSVVSQIRTAIRRQQIVFGYRWERAEFSKNSDAMQATALAQSRDECNSTHKTAANVVENRLCTTTLTCKEAGAAAQKGSFAYAMQNVAWVSDRRHDNCLRIGGDLS